MRNKYVWVHEEYPLPRANTWMFGKDLSSAPLETGSAYCGGAVFFVGETPNLPIQCLAKHPRVVCVVWFDSLGRRSSLGLRGPSGASAEHPQGPARSPDARRVGGALGAERGVLGGNGSLR